MTIYLDELLLVNFTADYLLLAAAAALSSSPLRRCRFVLSALIGSAYSLLTVFPEFFFLKAFPFRLISACLMTLTAFGFDTAQRFIRRSAVFFISGFAFAGFFELLFGSECPVPPSGVLIASSVLAYVLLSVFMRGTPAAAAAPAPKMQVHVETEYGHADFSAFADTGNRLRDPFTGDRVMILSLDDCSELLPKETAELLRSKGSTAAVANGGGLRLIPYKSLGGDGFLAAMRPLRLTINGREHKHTLIAFTCAELSESTGYSAIIGI